MTVLSPYPPGWGASIMNVLAAIKTLVAIVIEHTEDCVVAHYSAARFSTHSKTPTEASPFVLVVRDHHLGGGQIELYARARRFEAPR
jgi:hypothetical protein